MVLQEKSKNNPFIDLVNYKMRKVNIENYSDRFTDMYNEEHRLEKFLNVGSVSFVDDTKAQSVNAIWYSLENMKCPVTLIIKDIADMRELMKIKQLLLLKVKSIVFLSKKTTYIEFVSPLVDAIHFSESMEEAVRWSFENTDKNDAVLYSSGIKVNTEKESIRFRNAVRRL